MWPNLMGPGWQQQFLMAAGLLAAAYGVFWMMAAAAARVEADEPRDAVLKLWHRYEMGDLTRWEFDRAKRTMPGHLAATVVDRSPRAGVRHVPSIVKEGRSYMRTIIAVLILGVALVVNAATAFGHEDAGTSGASGNSDTRFFIGDGFDNATCADLPHGQTCK